MLLENSLWDMQPAWRLQQSPLHLPKDLFFLAHADLVFAAPLENSVHPPAKRCWPNVKSKRRWRKGYYTFSVRVVSEKRNIMLKTGGQMESKAGCCVWQASLGNWLHLTNEYRKSLTKTQLNHAFWHRKCNKNAKEKGKTISISMGLKSEARHKPTPIAMPFFATFLMGCYKEKAFCLA